MDKTAVLKYAAEIFHTADAPRDMSAVEHTEKIKGIFLHIFCKHEQRGTVRQFKASGDFREELRQLTRIRRGIIEKRDIFANQLCFCGSHPVEMIDDIFARNIDLTIRKRIAVQITHLDSGSVCARKRDRIRVFPELICSELTFAIVNASCEEVIQLTVEILIVVGVIVIEHVC